MDNLIKQFVLEGEPVSCEPYGCGHINRTYLLRTDTGRRYILQMLNGAVFPDPEGLMENVIAVTAFIARQAEDPREALRLNPTHDGGAQSYLTAELPSRTRADLLRTDRRA